MFSYLIPILNVVLLILDRELIMYKKNFTFLVFSQLCIGYSRRSDLNDILSDELWIIQRSETARTCNGNC